MKLTLLFLCFFSLVFCKLTQAQVTPIGPAKLTADSITIAKRLKTSLSHEDSTVRSKLNNKLASITDTAEGVSSIQKKSKDYLARLLKKKNELQDSFQKKRKVKLSNLAVENGLLLNNGFNSRNQESQLYNVSIFAQFQISRFPLAIDWSNNANVSTGLSSVKDALFKINLDPSQLTNIYQADLEKFSRFRSMELSGLDIPSYLKRNITQKLNQGVGTNLSQFPQLNAVMNNSKQLTALLEMDEDQLNDRLDQLMAQQTNMASDKMDSLSIQKRQQFQQNLEKKKQEVKEVIFSLNQKINSSGLDQQRLLMVQKFIANKGSVQDMNALFENELRQQGDHTTFGKFYSHLKGFQGGSFGQKMPGLLNRGLLIRGGDVSLRTSRGTAVLGLGTNKDVGMPKDAAFSKSLFAFPRLLSYVTIPATNFAFGRGKLSWVAAFDKRANNALTQQNSFPRNGSAFIVSQNVNFNTIGKFTVEMSKSSTQYKNISIAEADKIVLNNDLKMGNYFRDDFLETVSVGLKHNLELKKLGLTANSFFSYSGLGYQNPGQQGYGNLGMRMGGNLKKTFFHSKLLLNARTDIKNTPVSATSRAHWQNYNLQLDSRYRISKSYTVNLKYAENGVDKIDRNSSAVFASQKVQADLNANYKLGSNYGFSHLSVGRQLMLNPGLLTNTNFATLMYSQTVMLKTLSFSANAFYNKELNGERILGDMTNADLGCQFVLFRNVNFSSAITYLDNENIARQAGIRQSLQFSVLKNFDVSAFLDVRKNIIDPLYPELFSTQRGELSIRYYLNK